MATGSGTKAIVAAFFANLGIRTVLEGFSFRTAINESQPLREGRSWWQFVRTARVPELPVVLLEDLGPLVGLVLAFVAVALSVIPGNPVWDAIGTLTIGILLGSSPSSSPSR